MRFAVISDIHNNYPALEAVAEDIERLGIETVFVAGDFLNRGPQPRQVLAFLRERGWPLLRGNHEDYVTTQLHWLSGPKEQDAIAAHPIWQPARWTATQVRDEVLSLKDEPCSIEQSIQAVPLHVERETPAAHLIVHGLPGKNNDGVFRSTPDEHILEWLAAHNAARVPTLFVCAHTHASLMREVGETLVVNVGSVGLPFDGDPTARYGLFEWHGQHWNARIQHVEYDRAATLRAFATDGFYDGGGPLARVIAREVETARPHLGPWVRQFGDAVRENEISVAEAVQQYLAA